MEGIESILNEVVSKIVENSYPTLEPGLHPDDLKIDAHGKLLRMVIGNQGTLSTIIDTFNNWITNRIPLQLSNQRLFLNYSDAKSERRVIITFKNPILDYPKISVRSNTGNDKVALMMPRDASESGDTYSGILYCDMIMTELDGTEILRHPNIQLGSIPIMVRSDKCNTTKLSDGEKLLHGECIGDPGGYFIIKGTKRLVMIQEKLRVSRFFIFPQTPKSEPLCRITNETINGSSIISLYLDKLQKDIRIRIGFLGINNSIPVFSVFRLLGGWGSPRVGQDNSSISDEDINSMFNYIAIFTKPEWRSIIKVRLQSSFKRLVQFLDYYDINVMLTENDTKSESKSKSKNKGKKSEYSKLTTESERLVYIRGHLLDDLFPQITSQGDTRLYHKLLMLGMMIARFTEYLAGLRKYDDRDGWGNKRFESAGRAMEQLFTQMMKEIMNGVESKIKNTTISDLGTIKLTSSTVTDNFTSSFSSGKWGLKGIHIRKENVTDALKPENLISRYSQMTTVNTPASRRVKKAEVRLVSPSQTGYNDTIETPEGEQCVSLDTLVMLEDGTEIPISEIGNRKIITINPITLKKEISEIKNTFQYFSSDRGRQLFKLTTINGRSIKVTGDHPFLVRKNGNNSWIKTDGIKPGDYICVKFENSALDEYSKYLEYNSDNNPIPLNEFLEQNSMVNEFIYLKVNQIEEIAAEMVADFTTVSDNHSFIANRFVTHNCGMIKKLAITCWLSLDRGDDIILKNIPPIRETGEYKGWYYEFYNVKYPEYNTVIWLNGKIIGWCVGKTLKAECLRLRRSGVFPKDTCIVLDTDNILHIYTDASRPTRPLLIVNPNTGKLVIGELNLWDAPYNELLNSGAMEFIDAFEQDYIYLADRMDKVTSIADILAKQEVMDKIRQVISADDQVIGDTKIIENMGLTLEEAKRALQLSTGKREHFTHCEIDPIAILGFSSSINPYVNYNQAPRNTYQASMIKQALGIAHSNYTTQFDTTAKLLAYPSRACCETEMSQNLGHHSMPTGQTAILAITTSGGRTMEDAIEVSQGFLDRGGHRTIKYKSYKCVRKIRTSSDSIEEFVRPVFRTLHDQRQGRALGPDGIAILGSIVNENDVLICKERRLIVTDPKMDPSMQPKVEPRGPPKVEYENIRVGVGESGIVDKILNTTSADGMKQIVIVKIRQARRPIPGDKFATRYAQKATVAEVHKESSMPFIASGIYKGMRLDIMTNSHCIPSRMTIGMLIEMVQGKVSAKTCERINATPYRDLDIYELTDILKELGFKRTGTEFLRSGTTGEILKDPTGLNIEGHIFVGPICYQLLKHHVLDKIQVRSHGPLKQLTRQPTAGRANKGGQRVGEMERDSFISHGACGVIRDRLMLSSDAFTVVFCRTCGNMAHGDSGNYICRKCKTNDFGRVTMPYTNKLLNHYLAGAYYNVTYKLSLKVPKGQRRAQQAQQQQQQQQQQSFTQSISQAIPQQIGIPSCPLPAKKDTYQPQELQLQGQQPQPQSQPQQPQQPSQQPSRQPQQPSQQPSRQPQQPQRQQIPQQPQPQQQQQQLQQQQLQQQLQQQQLQQQQLQQQQLQQQRQQPIQQPIQQQLPQQQQQLPQPQQLPQQQQQQQQQQQLPQQQQQQQQQLPQQQQQQQQQLMQQKYIKFQQLYPQQLQQLQQKYVPLFQQNPQQARALYDQELQYMLQYIN